jgi:hypothetical protein
VVVTVTDFDVPRGWVRVRLADVLEEPLVNGRSGRHANDGFPVLAVTSLTEDGVDFSRVKKSDHPLGEGSPLLVSEGDFLVIRSNGSRPRIGRGALARCIPEAVALPSIMTRVRVHPGVVAPEFLEALWASSFVRRQLERATGASGPVLSLSHPVLKDIQLPLPPLLEQYRITEELRGRLDGLARGRDGLRRVSKRLPFLSVAARRATTPGHNPLAGPSPMGGRRVSSKTSSSRSKRESRCRPWPGSPVSASGG